MFSCQSTEDRSTSLLCENFRMSGQTFMGSLAFSRHPKLSNQRCMFPRVVRRDSAVQDQCNSVALHISSSTKRWKLRFSSLHDSKNSNQKVNEVCCPLSISRMSSSAVLCTCDFAAVQTRAVRLPHGTMFKRKIPERHACVW